MKILLTARLPHQPFNQALKAGDAAAKLNRILEAIKPEAAYFTEQGGLRCAMLVVEMADASKIPSLAEPWFLTFQADVEFRILMTPDDLKRGGLEEVARKWA